MGLNRSDRSWKQCGWGIAGASTQQLDLGHALDPGGRDLLGPDPDAQLTMGRGLAVSIRPGGEFTVSTWWDKPRKQTHTATNCRAAPE